MPIISAEERAAMIRAESEKIEREHAAEEVQRKEAEVKQQVAQFEQTDAEAKRKLAAAEQATKAAVERRFDQEAKTIELISAGETREMLYARLLQMREADKVKPPPPVPQRTPRQQAEYEAECRAGAEASAKVEAEADYFRELRRKRAEEEAARLGTMTTVHHANPTQTEMFPTTGATLGKPKK